MKPLPISGFPEPPSPLAFRLRRATERRLGFTLVEMLVAMSILTMLMVMVSQFMGMSYRSVSEARKRFELQGKARNALEIIARDIRDGTFQPGLASFSDGSGNLALAFYTSHLGLTATGDDLALYRPLSYVAYRTSYDAGAGLTSLYRGSVSLQWTLDDTYPAISANGNSLPFQTPGGTNDLHIAATTTGDSYQKLIDGVIRMEIGFLYDDGVVRTTFNLDPGTSTPPAPVAKAVVITLLVAADTGTQKILTARGTPELITTYFTGPGSPLPSRSAISTPSLRAEWGKVLNTPSTWSSFPGGVPSGIQAYERVVYIP